MQLYVLLLTTFTDCRSADNDPEASQCSTYKGFCKNSPDYKTSIGCSGTCIEKLSFGSDCSRRALNIHPFDLTIALDSGDDNACESGHCVCGTCASSAEKVPNGRR